MVTAGLIKVTQNVLNAEALTLMERNPRQMPKLL